MGDPLGYPEAVWTLFRETPRSGRFPPGLNVRASEAGTPAGRGRIRLECRIEENVFSESHFQAWGCPFSIACVAWGSEWLIG
jgi:hypothetical protein